MAGFDVVALGELLIDFTDSGDSPQGNPLMEANPGGAPCNVLAMLAKLGKKTAFIGKVGDDIFGRMLKTTIEEVGIDSQNLIFDKDVRTTLAFVKTYPAFSEAAEGTILLPEIICEKVVPSVTAYTLLVPLVDAYTVTE